MSLKNVIKKILTQYVGKHNDVSDDEFDPEKLKKGIGVEMEHTDDKELAKDHLVEDQKYYSKILDMGL